jgi:hypothetical protein
MLFLRKFSAGKDLGRQAPVKQRPRRGVSTGPSRREPWKARPSSCTEIGGVRGVARERLARDDHPHAAVTADAVQSRLPCRARRKAVQAIEPDRDLRCPISVVDCRARSCLRSGSNPWSISLSVFSSISSWGSSSTASSTSVVGCGRTERRPAASRKGAAGPALRRPQTKQQRRRAEMIARRRYRRTGNCNAPVPLCRAGRQLVQCGPIPNR